MKPPHAEHLHVMVHSIIYGSFSYTSIQKNLPANYLWIQGHHESFLLTFLSTTKLQLQAFLEIFTRPTSPIQLSFWSTLLWSSAYIAGRQAWLRRGQSCRLLLYGHCSMTVFVLTCPFRIIIALAHGVHAEGPLQLVFI